MLSLDTDKYFFSVYVVTNESPLDAGAYWGKNISRPKDITKDVSVYKKKYNVFFNSDDKLKIFKKKFKVPIHKLSITGDSLKEIKILPKTLMALWLQGIPKNYKLSLKTLPVSLVSIFYRWTDYTLGDDLSKLKNLKVFGAPGNHMIFRIPIFPKTIEYVDLSNCQINRFDNDGLQFFELKKYPNLKYINLSGNWIHKIPLEWRRKSSIKIIYNKQNK